VTGILSDITGRHPQPKKKVNYSGTSSIRVDTTYDNSRADPELACQLMRMDGKVQRSSPQSLSSVFEDIIESFPNPNEN